MLRGLVVPNVTEGRKRVTSGKEKRMPSLVARTSLFDKLRRDGVNCNLSWSSLHQKGDTSILSACHIP